MAIPPSQLERVLTREAHATWQGARGERRMPSRADMPPRLMRNFLKAMALVEILEGGRDFRFRVVGDAIATQQNLPLNGKTLTEVDAMVAGFGTFLKGVYRTAAEAGEPRAFRGVYLRTADNRPFRHETLFLPLGQDGNSADHLIVVIA